MLKIDITQIIRNMKAFKLLVTLLLVALSMGVSSCSEELDNQPMVSYPEGDEPLDIVCKEYGISDYEDIELFYYYKNGSVQANFSGLRDSKLWLAAFNVEDKSPIINWTDELPLIEIVEFIKAMENMRRCYNPTDNHVAVHVL